MTRKLAPLVAVTLTLATLSGRAGAEDAGSDAGAHDGGRDAAVEADAEAVEAVVAPAAPQATAPAVELTRSWTGTKLVVATKEAPPFAMKREDGSWEGISIDLWRRAAAELEIEYEFRETDIGGMVRGLEDGTYDAAVAAMTVTPRREQAFDFSHPFYSTGLGIAVSGEGSSAWSAVAALFSWEFVRALGALLLVLLAFGVVVWLLERRKNPDQFGGGVAKGIGAGFWFSAVTMTTVGYGDKAPVTLAGRLVTLVWMFVGVVTISGFTAAIASSLTVNRLGTAIQGPEDLVRRRVDAGTIPGTTSAAYLERRGVRPVEFETVLEGMRAVAAGEIDAMVYDQPILRYFANTELHGQVQVLPGTFERQDYAIGLPERSPIREDLNRLILSSIDSPWWDRQIVRYMGRD